jgi:hypothetical protein
MKGYLLKICAGEDFSKISLMGPQLNCSGAAGITREKTRNLATLYYGSEFMEEDFALLQDIERDFIPPGSIKHHDSTWPTEVRHTGRNFLCLEHILGRVPAVIKETHEPVQGPIPMLMIANPTGDLRGSQNEANYIMSQLRGSNLRISRYGSEIRKNDYLKLLESGKFSIIHYSGHSARSTELWKSCHVFLDDLCYGYEIEALKMKNPPYLVFSNSCESAEGSLDKDETGNTSLAGSYLKAGVGGCVGTIWNVSDVGSSNFASDFYRYLLFGATLGEALLNARKAAFKRWGYHNLIWGSYILFGDPEIRLVKRG